MRFLALFLFAALLCSSFFGSIRAQTHAEFDFEWLGITDVTAGEIISWNAGKVNEGFEFQSMFITFVPFTATQLGATAGQTLEQLPEASVKAAMENAEASSLQLIRANNGANCVSVSPCTVITPSASTCYRLVFDNNSFLSSYKIDMNTPDIIALGAYSEHVPSEFVSAVDFFIDSKGHSRSFLYEEFDHEHNHDHPQTNAKKIQSVNKNVNALKNKIGKH